MKQTESTKVSNKITLKNDLNRNDVIQITSVQLKNQLKAKQRETQKAIKANKEIISEKESEIEEEIQTFIEKQCGSELNILTGLHTIEAKAQSELFRKFTDQIEEAAKKLFPDIWDVRSHLGRKEPTPVLPSTSLTYTLGSGSKKEMIYVNVSYRGLSVQKDLKLSSTILTLKKETKKSMSDLEDLQEVLEEVNYQLANVEDIKEELKAKLAEVDLSTSELGAKYTKALQSYSNPILKGLI